MGIDGIKLGTAVSAGDVAWVGEPGAGAEVVGVLVRVKLPQLPVFLGGDLVDDSPLKVFTSALLAGPDERRVYLNLRAFCNAAAIIE
jgi:hypothetical protein